MRDENGAPHPRRKNRLGKQPYLTGHSIYLSHWPKQSQRPMQDAGASLRAYPSPSWGRHA